MALLPSESYRFGVKSCGYGVNLGNFQFTPFFGLAKFTFYTSVSDIDLRWVFWERSENYSVTIP